MYPKEDIRNSRNPKNKDYLLWYQKEYRKKNRKKIQLHNHRYYLKRKALLKKIVDTRPVMTEIPKEVIKNEN